MNKETVELAEITLVGVSARTNNIDEMNPETSKIAALAGSFWHEQLANNFQHRMSPGVTYSVYTEYESDEHGDYTYFIGEAVCSLEDQDLSTFKTLTIPASTYRKFTTDDGEMPAVVINAWQKIWTMTKDDFGGNRSYIADFEIYDEKAIDPSNAVVDIYLGITD